MGIEEVASLSIDLATGSQDAEIGSAVLPEYGAVACIDCHAVGTKEERRGADRGVWDVGMGGGSEEEVGVD